MTLLFGMVIFEDPAVIFFLFRRATDSCANNYCLHSWASIAQTNESQEGNFVATLKSNEKKTGCSGDIRDYTTQLCGYYTKPL